METWRIVATVLMTVCGLILMLVAMAQVRDRKRSTPADVRTTALIGLGIIAVLDVLIATILPSTVAWGIIAASAILIGIVTLLD